MTHDVLFYLHSIIHPVGVFGTVTVAGLTPQLDHDYAVAGVKHFLN
ncbi:hypothetical protein [Peribacillus sp. NPDC058002]